MTTQFQALCSQDEAGMPNVNVMGKEVFEPILNGFAGYVLPHRDTSRPSFKDSECSLYVNRRDWQAKIDKEGFEDNWCYEILMEALFWGGGKFADKIGTRRLIFVSGTIGSGKSTFTDYYLRCYCSQHSERRSEFANNLILHFDLKNKMTPETVNAAIWSDFVPSLKRADVDPYSIYGFDNELEPTISKIKRVLQIISKKNEISKLGNKLGKSNTKKKLILVIDNIDQSPVDCQAHVLGLVQDLLQVTSQVDVWKVIFPLWPQTLSRLKRESRLTLKDPEYF